jgi:hypothetical protein
MTQVQDLQMLNLATKVQMDLTGDDYEGIEFIDVSQSPNAEFEAGFAQYEASKADSMQQQAAKETAKPSLALRITAMI